MANEIKNVEIEEIENLEDLESVEGMELYEDSDSSVLGLILLGVGAGIVGAGATLYHKNKAKIEEWRIKRWEKKGYVITRPDVVVDIQEPDSEGTDAPEEVVEPKPKKTQKKKTE